MSGLAFTPAQQRLTMALAGVSLIPAFASEPMDAPRIAASLTGRRRAVACRPQGGEGVKAPCAASPVLLVELVVGPRRIRELLVQRLPVADAAPQELGPGGDGDPRIERFRHQPPQVRM